MQASPCTPCFHIIGESVAPLKMEVNGQQFPISAMVQLAPGVEKPLLDIPQMSDFAWQLGALESRLTNPGLYLDRLGENVTASIAHLRRWLWAHLDEATPQERKRFQEVTL